MRCGAGRAVQGWNSQGAGTIPGSAAELELGTGASVEYPVPSTSQLGCPVQGRDHGTHWVVDSMTAGWNFLFAAVTPSAWGPSGLGQITQLLVLVLGSMPAPVAMRGFCVTFTGGDRRADLAHNLFLKNSRFKATPSMLSFSIACLQC